MRAPLVIGLDVGGTKILSDLVDREGAIVALHEEPSPGESEEEVLGALDAAVEALLDDRGRRDRLRHPGQPRRGTRRILNGMNLPLDDVDLIARSRTRFGLPIGIENDGSATALAEWKRGGGRLAANLVMLTLGTGVGGGVVIDGRLFLGWGRARAHRRAGGWR